MADTAQLFMQDPGDRNTLYLFGEFASWWGITATATARMLQNTDPDRPVLIYLNSPGGSVSTAVACKAMIEHSNRQVKIVVAGLAASAATLITSCRNAHVVMTRGSLMMIHNPACSSYGDARELQKSAEVLDKTKQEIVEIYQQRTRKSAEELDALMNDEIWMSCDEALANGFIDEIDNETEVSTEVDQAKKQVQITNMSNKHSLVMSLSGGNPTVFSDFSEIRGFLNMPEIQNTTPNQDATGANTGVSAPDMAGQNNVATPVAPAVPVASAGSMTGGLNMAQSAPVAPPAPNIRPQMTAEGLRQACMSQYPEAFEEMTGQIAAAERARIQSLDEFAGLVSNEILNKAKYQDLSTQEQLAMNYMKDQLHKKQQEVANNAQQTQNYISAGNNAATMFGTIEPSPTVSVNGDAPAPENEFKKLVDTCLKARMGEEKDEKKARKGEE